MTPAYALVWRRDRSEGIRWYIRFLTPEYFYGEIGYNSSDLHGGRVIGVRGHISVADGERIKEILRELSEAGPTEPGPSFAILGSYTETLGQSTIIFKYDWGTEESCPRARLFMELHSIIEAYLVEAYAQIMEGH
jgi:hypothetical protein